MWEQGLVGERSPQWGDALNHPCQEAVIEEPAHSVLQLVDTHGALNLCPALC